MASLRRILPRACCRIKVGPASRAGLMPLGSRRLLILQWAVILISVVWCLPGCIAEPLFQEAMGPEAGELSLRGPSLPTHDSSLASEQSFRSPCAIRNVTTVASPEYPPRRVSLAECL